MQKVVTVFVKKLALIGGMFTAVVFLFVFSAQAQRPLEKFGKRFRDAMPKGELMKRIRDRIEKNEEQRKRAAAAKKAAEARKKTAERNRKSSQNRDRGPQPTLADPRGQISDPYQDDDLKPQKLSSKEAKKYEQYGFRVAKTPNGVLGTAGVRKGDRVLGVGGMPVESMKEVDEVINLLGKGDRIEIVISRSGRKYQLMGTNGKADPNEIASAPSQLRAPRQLSKINNDFAPPMLDRGKLPAPRGMSSVVEQTTPKVIPNTFVPPKQNMSSRRKGTADPRDEEIKKLREQLRQMKLQMNKQETGSGVK